MLVEWGVWPLPSGSGRRWSPGRRGWLGRDGLVRIVGIGVVVGAAGGHVAAEATDSDDDTHPTRQPPSRMIHHRPRRRRDIDVDVDRIDHLVGPAGIVVSTGGAQPSADDDGEAGETTETVAPTETTHRSDGRPGTGTRNRHPNPNRNRNPTTPPHQHRATTERSASNDPPVPEVEATEVNVDAGYPAHRRKCRRRNRSCEFLCRTNDVIARSRRRDDHGDDADRAVRCGRGRRPSTRSPWSATWWASCRTSSPRS